VAAALSGAGHTVSVLGRTEESLRETVRSGAAADYRLVDVTDEAALTGCLKEIGAIDILVNNAGVADSAPFLKSDLAFFRRLMAVDFESVVIASRAVLPGMIERKRGHIIIVGSIAGRSAFVGGTAYAASKHAIAGFAECLMLEVRHQGVKVSTVNPGSVATAFSRNPDESWMLSPDEVADSIAHVIATPHDVLVHSVEIRALAPKK
jgi:NADP-dependent 3-hydroxy acid dehydrogenase YdfG